MSAHLDELSDELYFSLEPQRHRHRRAMLAALQTRPASPMTFDGWIRVVTFQFSTAPLSAAGSLSSHGGRFNVGMDVDRHARPPWPALYVAADFETAFREKFGISRGDGSGGLSPEELSLTPGVSIAAVRIRGHIEKIFNVGDLLALAPLCAVLKRFTVPPRIPLLRKKLKIAASMAKLVTTPLELQRQALDPNWRGVPAQFGLPSTSQILGELIRDAGYEAIAYPSTKNGAHCMAVFPDSLASDLTHVELVDEAPAGTACSRLDLTSADSLCGWERLRERLRPSFGHI